MFYFSKQLGDDRLLCLAPLTNRLQAVADVQPDNCSGYFLFEQFGIELCKQIRILAQVHTDDAAMELKEMMQLS
nr:hypothetical protein [uncultured Hyphomonas sp.]